MGLTGANLVVNVLFVAMEAFGAHVKYLFSIITHHLVSREVYVPWQDQEVTKREPKSC